jgi:hypothetical protein
MVSPPSFELVMQWSLSEASSGGNGDALPPRLLCQNILFIGVSLVLWHP